MEDGLARELTHPSETKCRGAGETGSSSLGEDPSFTGVTPDFTKIRDSLVGKRQRNRSFASTSTCCLKDLDSLTCSYWPGSGAVFRRQRLPRHSQLVSQEVFGSCVHPEVVLRGEEKVCFVCN